MINLLPPETRESYRYARRNTALRSWVIVSLVALVGLGALGTFGLLSMKQESLAYAKRISVEQEQLEANQLAQTEKQVKEISGSLKLATQVLGEQVLFSQLITQIGAAMPPGAILTGLNINEVDGGLDLSAKAKNYDGATQVQVNLSNSSSKIFNKVDINSISCAAPAGESATHPCTVTLRALFNPENQFLFINQVKKR